EFVARLDVQREMIESDSELGELSVVPGLMCDEPESKPRGGVDHVDHPSRHLGKRVLSVLGNSFHAEHLLIPGGASLRVTHGEFNVRNASEMRHVYPLSQSPTVSAYCPMRS